MTKKQFYSKKSNLYVLAVICTIMWGSCYPLVKVNYDLLKINSEDVGAQMLLAGIRFIIAGIILLSYCALTKKVVNEFTSFRDSIKVIFLLCFTHTILQYVFSYIGLANTTSIKGTLIKETSSFFIILASPLFFKEVKLKARCIFGCLLGFVGLVIINLGGSFTLSVSFLGEGFMFFASLTSAAGYLFSKNLLKGKNTAIVMGYQQLIGGVILAAIGLCSFKTIYISLKGIGILLIISVISAVSNVLWMQLIKYNDITKVTVFGFFTPLFGTLFSSILLNENILEMKNILSLTFVCVGIYLINKQNKKTQSQKA